MMRIVLTTAVCPVIQIQAGSSIWEIYNSIVPSQRCWSEKTGRPRLRRYSTGDMILNLVEIWHWYCWQCAIPCFEGLLPSPHNEMVLDLLFISAYWHGLGKLRMHTDSSLEVLDISIWPEVTRFCWRDLQKFRHSGDGQGVSGTEKRGSETGES